MKKLEGQVALITGGSRGLGRGMTFAFAEAGMKVAFNYLQATEAAQEVVKGVEERGSEAFAKQADITQEKDVEDLVSEVLERYGKIDILVNNAGVAFPKPFTDMSISDWDKVQGVHVRGMFLCSHFVVPSMIERGKGNIINMVGSFGIKPEGLFAHVSAAKASMIAFTRALAHELSPQGVRVNAVCPAMIKTEMIENYDPEMLETLRQRYPLRRLGEVEDVTATVLFLASDDSAYYTGQTLAPCGGDVMV